MKDTLFLDPGQRYTTFAFDESVTAVFDDMLKRSVPFYFEIQNMITDLIECYHIPGCNIVDLGCSTGTTIALLSQRLSAEAVHYLGIDNSEPMLKKAQSNLHQLNIVNYTLHQADLNRGIVINNASAVILNLVLQFVQPDNRRQLIKNAYDGLAAGGCLLLVEKIIVDDPVVNENFISCHHAFKKRNLYTDDEIARKRESLENFLIPWTAEQNSALLKDAGFRPVEIFFKWFNFCGLIAVKPIK